MKEGKFKKILKSMFIWLIKFSKLLGLYSCILNKLVISVLYIFSAVIVLLVIAARTVVNWTFVLLEHALLVPLVRACWMDLNVRYSLFLFPFNT